MVIHLYAFTQLYSNAACQNSNDVTQNTMVVISILILSFPLGFKLESDLQTSRLHSEGRSSLAVIALSLCFFVSLFPRPPVSLVVLILGDKAYVGWEVI